LIQRARGFAWEIIQSALPCLPLRNDGLLVTVSRLFIFLSDLEFLHSYPVPGIIQGVFFRASCRQLAKGEIKAKGKRIEKASHGNHVDISILINIYGCPSSSGLQTQIPESNASISDAGAASERIILQARTRALCAGDQR
jgi:hypothetical protein